jgi:hypothetical protein
MDLDFGLPASLQQGMEILFSEILCALWDARNDTIFQRKRHDDASTRELAVRRIKVRLKAECQLHGVAAFNARWPQDWWWCLQQNDVCFLF